MIRKFLVPVFLLFSIIALAQQGTSSPYSFYGIGDIRFKGTVENRSMGGVSVFTDSIHINLQNPASYSGLKLTSFTLGGSANYSKYTALNSNEKAQRSTFDYLAIGIPMGKFGAVLGLMPYSSVGYRIRTEGVESLGDESRNVIHRYNGSGNINKAFLGLAYQIMPNLSVGADFNYNFGEIQTASYRVYTDFQYGTLESNRSQMSGFNVNLGLMYQRKLNDKLDLYGGLTYTPESVLKTDNTRLLSSILYSEDLTSGGVDVLDAEESKRTLKMPSKFSFGAGIGQKRKWLVGAEVSLQQSNKMGNRFDDITNATFENAVKYSVGGYYIPNYNSFSNYFSKIVYRAGFRYENTGLIVNNESIKDYAFTGGLGFPLGGAFSNLNVGAEFGRRGTAKALLVEENYANVIISLSLNDRWFIKRRYD